MYVFVHVATLLTGWLKGLQFFPGLLERERERTSRWSVLLLLLPLVRRAALKVEQGPQFRLAAV
jgi:hypothetical protein